MHFDDWDMSPRSKVAYMEGAHMHIPAEFTHNRQKKSYSGVFIIIDEMVQVQWIRYMLLYLVNRTYNVFYIMYMTASSV